MLNWRPIAERPEGSIATAMIRHADHDGVHLMPGPVTWDARHGAWVSECSGLPVKMSDSGVFHWIPEEELLT